MRISLWLASGLPSRSYVQCMAGWLLGCLSGWLRGLLVAAVAVAAALADPDTVLAKCGCTEDLLFLPWRPDDLVICFIMLQISGAFKVSDLPTRSCDRAPTVWHRAIYRQL